MTKLSLALSAALVASAAAFAPAPSAKVTTSVTATGFEEVGGVAWDPLSLGKLEDANDTFPNMFPKSQFLQEAEIKHGRMSMLAWTGVWATHVVRYLELTILMATVAGSTLVAVARRPVSYLVSS